ncbi:hypothetical protein GHT06_011166 [Daphnia sinensis]|uniref:BTB domain-containing protein n=1 Tax=Daphnia sinensis TaxID=1820382 RepID=A0AAD5PY33_9CRUS|nr:hypothetical protein GHT06_011166 [Daphnia sinensis]
MTLGTMEMSHHQFCLKWNNHSSNLLKVFGRLFSNESFTDVTLAAEGRSIRAHKMVLSACSTYFEQLFLEHAEPPVTGPMIVIMRETSFDDLAIIVEFMYKGEINVSQDQLGSLLRTAESLRVKGLAQASSGGHGDAMDQPSFTAAAPAPPAGQQQQQQPVSLTTGAAAAAPCRKTPTPTTTPPHSQSSTFSPPPHAMGQAPPPPALLPLFQNAALLSAAITTVVESSSSSTGRESPSSKRRRIRPKIEPGTASHQEHSNYSDNSRPSSATFTPRIENVVTMGPPPRNEATAETPTRSETMESAPTSALDLRLTDPSHLQELSARLELRGNFAIQPPDGDSETLRKVQQEKSEPHCFFRGYAVYKFNDYIAHGTRQQYWEEPFTKAVMEGIQALNCWACRTALCTEGTANATAICATPGRGTTAARRDPGPAATAANENGGMTAEELVVEVDSYMDEDVIVERMSSDKSPADIDAANKQESLILSIRHGKVQRKLQGAHHKESS